MFVFFFFFQAEDGIRDSSVTGVQTCALPISATAGSSSCGEKWPVIDSNGRIDSGSRNACGGIRDVSLEEGVRGPFIRLDPIPLGPDGPRQFRGPCPAGQGVSCGHVLRGLIRRGESGPGGAARREKGRERLPRNEGNQFGT